MIRIEDLDLTSLRLRDNSMATGIPGHLIYRASGCVKEPESTSVANRLDAAGFKAIDRIEGV